MRLAGYVTVRFSAQIVRCTPYWMLLRKYIATAFKIPVFVKELLEPARLIYFIVNIKLRNFLMDMKGTFLFRLTIIILTVVITFILSVSLEHFQRYHPLSN